MKKLVLLSITFLLGATVFAQSKIGTELLSQNFSSGLGEWTIDAQTGNWGLSSTVNAGGEAPEAKMSWSPQFNGTTRLISPVVDVSSHSNLSIEFKHAIDHYSGSYDVGLATRSDEGAWHTVWSRKGANVVETISLPIENEDLGSASFQFCLFFTGSSYNINAWYIDDILCYVPFETDLAVNSIDNIQYSLFGDRNIEATAKNVGINPITSFDIQYQIDEGNVITESVTGISLNAGDSYSHTFTSLWEATAGTYDVSVSLTNINGNGDDDDMSNNTKVKSLSLASQAVANLPLFESFTSSTCGPCNSFNTGTFTPFLNTHAGEFAVIKYQMDWPGNGDPYYTAEGGVRKSYYGVSGVPNLFTGGVSTPTSAAGVNSAFTTQSAKDAFFEISATAGIVDGTNVSVSIDILPHISATNFTLHAAVVERETTGNVGSNGETSFKYVMMKMLPDANGTVFSSTDGETITFNLSADLSTTHVEEFDDLMVVAFIQNDDNKEVFQSTMVDVAFGNFDYSVTFTVLDETTEAPIEGATISINEQTLTTTDAGIASIMLQNDSYEYTISKEMYESVENSLTVNGSDIEITEYLTQTTSVNTSALSTLSVYPNPTQGEVIIKAPTDENINTVKVYSITGALVYSKQYSTSLNEVKLNINQPQGVYMVRVTLNNGNTSIGKLIVN
ncbi:MAG: T9SS type A sorting domain-containing protein [Bacteroidales bacterium]|nr:T9SS type A sorting domain-containing protein [Bacteroidales bacterium]MDD4673522.1 T9SS type A sorting domain-containing protein [Bacteroidales bacterium]MDY0348555.1 T9SS type A sorting domain-containing protein [Tenuifilaceae bacterium]